MHLERKLMRTLLLFLISITMSLATTGPTQKTGSASPFTLHITTGTCTNPPTSCIICLFIRDKGSNATVWTNLSNFTSSTVSDTESCNSSYTQSRNITESTDYTIDLPDEIEGRDLEGIMTCQEYSVPLATCISTPASTPVTLSTDTITDPSESSSHSHGRIRFEERWRREGSTSSGFGWDPDGDYWTCEPDSGGKYLYVDETKYALVNDPTSTGALCYPKRLTYTSDQYVLVRLCSSSASSNIDFTFHLRSDEKEGGISWYGFKVENGSNHFQVLYDNDGDGTFDTLGGEYQGACGLNAATNFPSGGSCAWWRIEAYTDPSDPNQVRLRAWSAPDVSGSPGTWTAEASVDHGTVDTCAAWATMGIPSGHGIAITNSKSGTHEFHLLQYGDLVEKGGGFNVHRRSP